MPLFTLVLTSAVAAGPTEYRLEWLETRWGDSGVAYDVNNAGQVVGVMGLTAGDHVGFVWQGGTVRLLNTLAGGLNSSAHGINEHGQIVGYCTRLAGGTSWNYTKWDAVMWDADGSVFDLGWGHDHANTVAYDINNAGQIVGSDEMGWNPRYSEDYLSPEQLLPDLRGNSEGGAAAINDAGIIVGRARSGDWSSDMVRWFRGRPYSMGMPGFPADINELGLVCGTSSPRAFLWDPARGLLPLENANHAQAIGLNNVEQVVGYFDDHGTTRACLWQDGAIHDLNTMIVDSPGGHLQDARAINDHGVIVGHGTDPSGGDRPFVLTPIPEPAALSLLVLGGAAMLRRRRTAAHSHPRPHAADATRSQRPAIRPTPLLAALACLLALHGFSASLLGDIQPGRTIRITDHVAKQKAPSISGDIVVWEDHRSGQAEIYGYNLVTEQEFPIATGGRAKEFPQIDGSLVMWKESFNDTNRQLFCKDLDSGQVYTVEGGVTYLDLQYSAMGRTIYYSAQRGMYNRQCVYSYDVDTNDRRLISGGTRLWHRFPEGKDGYVAWSAYGNLGIYDVEADDIRDVDVGDFVEHLSVARGRACFLSASNELSVYDIPTQSLRTYMLPGSNDYPVADGDLVILMDRAERKRIRALDLSTEQLFDVYVAQPGDVLHTQLEVDVSGMRVVWTHLLDDSYTKMDIYVTELVPEPATLSLLALGALVMIRRRRR